MTDWASKERVYFGERHGNVKAQRQSSAVASSGDLFAAQPVGCPAKPDEAQDLLKVSCFAQMNVNRHDADFR